VPNTVVNNAQQIVSQVTNDAFNGNEMNQLTSDVISGIGYLDAARFVNVGLDQFGNVPLSSQQKKIIDGLLEKIKEQRGNDDLAEKAIEEWKKALGSGKCYVNK
jgi:hypothetical protein